MGGLFFDYHNFDLHIDSSGIGNGKALVYNSTTGELEYQSVGGIGGNPFDQSLNTTDSVQFNQININGLGIISTYQNDNNNQLAFNIGEQGFSMGYDDINGLNAISLFNNNLYMNNGQGQQGGTIWMDGGQIKFPTVSGNYNYPAYIAAGTVDDGAGGGVSLFCNNTYEINWQNGVLKINGDNFNGGGVIKNVANISGPSTNAPTTATATLIFDPNNLPTDGQLIVLTFAGNDAHVLNYSASADGSDHSTFNLNSSNVDAGFITNVINGANLPASASFDNVNTVTLTCNTSGDSGNQQNGSTLANCTLTNFTGGGPGPNLLTIDSNVVIDGTLAFTKPYITLTEANNNQNLDTQYDTYFLYVGPDNNQFGVNLPDPATMIGRELTFINTGQQSEYAPYMMGNIQNSAGNSYNLTNTSVKLLSDGTTWWITSQV